MAIQILFIVFHGVPMEKLPQAVMIRLSAFGISKLIKIYQLLAIHSLLIVSLGALIVRKLFQVVMISVSVFGISIIFKISQCLKAIQVLFRVSHGVPMARK